MIRMQVKSIFLALCALFLTVTAEQAIPADYIEEVVVVTMLLDHSLNMWTIFPILS